MKTNKLLAAIAVAIFSLCSVNALAGGAVGFNIGSGLGVSYQQDIAEKYRLDIAFHLPYATNNGIGAGGIVTFDWVDPAGTTIPWDKAGEWHWCAGVGVASGAYNFINPYWYAGVAGHVGIEYDFKFPMQLSLDWRPNLGVRRNHEDQIVYNTFGLYDNITMGIRYRF